MGFWIFMLVMVLLLPASMLGLGRWFMKQAPGKINYVFGYRTRRSMKNPETWAFAHHYFGRIWYISGLVSLPLSIAAMLLVLGRGTDAVSAVGSVLCCVQLIPVVCAIIPTERALRREFDDDGNRRSSEK